MHQPKVLLLDEPFTGLDPEQIILLQKRIKEYTQKGNVVLLSSHILDFVAKLCNKVVVMDHGKNVTTYTKEDWTTTEMREKLDEFFQKMV